MPIYLVTSNFFTSLMKIRKIRSNLQNSIHINTRQVMFPATEALYLLGYNTVSLVKFNGCFGGISLSFSGSQSKTTRNQHEVGSEAFTWLHGFASRMKELFIDTAVRFRNSAFPAYVLKTGFKCKVTNIMRLPVIGLLGVFKQIKFAFSGFELTSSSLLQKQFRITTSIEPAFS